MPREMKWRNHEGSQLPWLYFFVFLLLAHIQNSNGRKFPPNECARRRAAGERRVAKFSWKMYERERATKNKHRHRARAAANFLLHNNDELLTPFLVDPSQQIWAHTKSNILNDSTMECSRTASSARNVMRWSKQAKKKVDQSRKPNVGQKFGRN